MRSLDRRAFWIAANQRTIVNFQVHVLQEVLRKYSCLDPARVAAFGWSYGGYAALISLSDYPQHYVGAIAGTFS